MTKPIQLKLGFEPKERLARFRKRNPFLKRLALSTYEKELLGYHRWTGAIKLKTRGDKYEMSNKQLIIKKGYFIAIDVNFMRSAVIVCVTRGWGWEVSFVSYYRYFPFQSRRSECMVLVFFKKRSLMVCTRNFSEPHQTRRDEKGHNMSLPAYSPRWIAQFRVIFDYLLKSLPIIYKSCYKRA